MTPNVECAAISVHVYNDQQGGGGAIGDANRFDFPTGWLQLSTSTGFAVGDTLNATNPFSFTGHSLGGGLAANDVTWRLAA